MRRIRDQIEVRVQDLIDHRLHAIRGDRTAHQHRLARMLPGLIERFPEKSDAELRTCADAVLAEFIEAPVRSFVTTIAERRARTHGGDEPRAEIECLAREGHSIRDEIAASVGHARRVGPDAVRLLAICDAITRVVDALDDLAWAWARYSVVAVSDPVLAVRDLARELAHVVAELDGDDREAHLARADELALEARHIDRYRLDR